MRSLLRSILLCCSILSLLFCAAVFVLWVRSDLPDVIHYTSKNKWSLTLISGHGTIDVSVIPHWDQDPELRYSRYDHHVYYGTRYSKRLLGFGTDVIWPEYGGRYVNIPHWFLATLSGGLCVVFARAWWKRRKRDLKGRCRKCGYDMRATPNCCPECGARAQVV